MTVDWIDLAKTYGKAPAIFASVLVLGLGLRRVLMGRLHAWARKSVWKWDDLVVDALQRPLLIWIFILALNISLRSVNLPERLDSALDKTLIGLLILSIIIVLTQMTSRGLRAYAAQVPAFPRTSLITNLSNTLIIIIGGLVLLNYLGISITPMLTALGVGGLAVALALQETLANLFAGFYMTVTRRLRPGDYVKIESGDEGFVEDTGWRETIIRTLPGNMIIVPNSKLAQTIVTNYNSPTKDLAVLVQVGVAYASDLKKVERVTVEVGRDVMKTVEGGVPDFEPFIRYHTFADFSINFTVILRGQDFVAQYLVKHEFIKRLHERYDKEGIEIPFPIRTVHLQNAPGVSV